MLTVRLIIRLTKTADQDITTGSVCVLILSTQAATQDITSSLRLIPVTCVSNISQELRVERDLMSVHRRRCLAHSTISQNQIHPLFRPAPLEKRFDRGAISLTLVLYIYILSVNHILLFFSNSFNIQQLVYLFCNKPSIQLVLLKELGNLL